MCVQEAAYLQLLLPIFEPRTRSEETTGPNWMKLGIHNLCGNTNNIIEAFFDIPTPSRDMEPLMAAPGGSPGPKKFFSIFLFFFA